jgi:hypothetical protein
MKIPHIRKKRIPLSEIIRRVGAILCAGRTRAFGEDELQRLAGENTQAVDVRNALSILKQGGNFQRDIDGKWRYSGRF